MWLTERPSFLKYYFCSSSKIETPPVDESSRYCQVRLLAQVALQMAANGLCDSTWWLVTSSPLTCFSDDHDAKQPVRHNTC